MIFSLQSQKVGSVTFEELIATSMFSVVWSHISDAAEVFDEVLHLTG